MADTRSDEEKASDIVKMLEQLKKIRSRYEPMVDDIITYVYHSRQKIADNTDGTEGMKTGDMVFDGTALNALNLLTDGLCGYSVSKSFRWFNYTLPGKLNFPRTSGMRAWSGKSMDEYPEVKLWLEEVEEVMYAAYLRSNFYDQVSEIVREAASIGTVVTTIEEDIDHDRIVFSVPHFREIFVAEDRFGTVDTLYHNYYLTLRQLADKFGVDKMQQADPKFEDELKSNPYKPREILNAIYPRSDFDSSKLDKKNKPWASMWVLKAPQKLLLEESGYDDKPFVCWRWRKNATEVYGRSPAWDAIVPIMTANQIAETNLVAGHKMVDPPIIAPEDMRGKVVKAPGGWTFYSNFSEKNMPRPLLTGIQLPYAIDQQERIQQSIKEHFHVDFFLMLSQAAMNKVDLTATQVIEMSGEKAAVLGTRIGRQESELLNPVHDRVFNIENKSGRIPPPPDILMENGGSIEIDYLGPLAQAQRKMFKSQVMRAGIQIVGEASTVWPEVRHVIDPMKTTRDLLDSQGFPAKDFRTDEEIDEILDEENKQQHANDFAENAPKVAKGVSALTKGAQPGSPLEALTGLSGEA